MCGYIGSVSKDIINLDILNKANEKIICEDPIQRRFILMHFLILI